MSAPESVEFAGTDEELDRYLREFAGRTGGWVRPDPRRGGRRVGGGALLCTHPNFAPWQVHVARAEGGLRIRALVVGLPWSRRKLARLADYRRGQLADYLATRLRGGGPEKFDPRRLAEPFTAFGADAAAVTMSFAWNVVSALGAMAAALGAVTLAVLPLMHLAIGEITDRARTIAAAGGVPLPSLGELASLGAAGRLACALLFAAPVAFFFGLLHSAALLLGEAWPRAARAGQASFFFLSALLTLALFPFLPWLALPLALLAAAATHAGYAAVWGRRRERVREGPGPSRAMIASGVLLGALVLASLVPRWAQGKEFTDRLALFRDRFLLANPPGKEAAAFYYRYTLYTADPLKQFYASDPKTPVRSQRTVRMARPDPAAEAFFRGAHFTVVKDPAARVDVVHEGPPPAPDALDRRAAEAFRGTWLRELSARAWQSVYYAGPPFVLLAAVGAFCPLVSILFRKLAWKKAAMAMGGAFAGAAAAILLYVAVHAEELRRLSELSRNPSPPAIAAALSHPVFGLRHRAVYLAYRRPDPSLAEPLLKAASDPDVRIRIWACGALGLTKDPRAREALEARLADPELFVRYRAAEGLGLLGDPRSVPGLARLLREGTWYEGVYALEALRRLRPGEF